MNRSGRSPRRSTSTDTSGSAGGAPRGVNLATTRVVIRERPLTDVVDLAIRFLFANGRAFAALGVAVVAPACVATLALGLHSGWGYAWLLAFALAPLVGLPFTLLASRLVFERAVPARAVVAATLRAVPRLAAARVVMAMGVLLGATMMMLPGAWIWVQFYFVGEVSAVERAGPIAAFGRASRVVSGRFGTAMATSMLLLGMHLVATILGDVAGRSAMTELLQIAPPPPLLEAGGSALAFVGFWGFLPLLVVGRFFVYLDLRTRLEGWDVQTRFAAIAQRAQQDERDAQGPISSRREAA